MTHLPAPVRLNERVQIMGVLNRTPDSFYDGGTCVPESIARARLAQLIEEGADIVDIGGESSRPGARPVEPGEQLARIGRLIELAVAAGAFVSVDTTHPEVAEAALSLGARMVNSVSLEPAAELGRVAAKHGAHLVLTHCRGSMSQMSGFSTYDSAAYDDLFGDIAREWSLAADEALGAGLPSGRLVFDPGLGFTKNAEQSLEICARLGDFRRLGYPILVGASRKSYLAEVVATEVGGAPPPPADRLGASIAAAIAAAAAGADIVRVHDVAATRQALAYARALDACQRRAAMRAHPPAPVAPVDAPEGGPSQFDKPVRDQNAPSGRVAGGAGA